MPAQMTKPDAGVMGEDPQAAAPAAPTGEAPTGDQQSTVELPLTAFPQPPKAGDMLQLKVVSVDANSGVVNAVPVQGEVEPHAEEANEGGSDSLAKEFDQPK